MGTTVLMDWRIPRAAYLHVPFCGHHCGYCDFAVSTEQALQAQYLQALALEMQGKPQTIDTIFIGGGTPTLLPPARLGQLMALIQRRFPGPWSECTIESTPETVTADKLALLRHAGLTRISIGVQTFNPQLLRTLERLHGVHQAQEAVRRAHSAGLHVSLDLIFAIPGQTIEAWRADLAEALRLEPEHISVYGLTYEKGTPLWKQRERGLLPLVSDDLELQMYATAIETLTQAGYEHYEISNFARPGHRCRHNEIYWANHAYYGFGVGAAQYVDGVRRVNIRDTAMYIRRLLAGESVVQNSECLAPRERALETAAVQLRRSAGIHRAMFRQQCGYDLNDIAGEAIGRLTALGLLEADADRVRLSARGKPVADAIIAELFR